jgi:putative hemolysin
MSTTTEVTILFALILANGLLAGAEIAVVSMRSSRIDELIGRGSKTAALLRRMRAAPERFFATVQVGITVFGVTAGAFGAARFAADLAAVLERWAPLAPYARSVSYVLVVAAVTYLSIVLGELVPKSLALRRAELYGRMIARPLAVLEAVAAPIVWFLTASSNLVLRAFGDRTDFLETKVSLEEVRHMVDDARERGSLDPGVGLIASRALDLSELTAGDVMIHRRFVRALPLDADADTVREVFLDAGHRRLPIYEGTIDNIVGYIAWRDLVERLWSGKSVSVPDLLRSIRIEPASAPAAPLLRTMQEARQHLVAVADEHGGVAGIVTLEDLLEEIVGEIDSEHGRPIRLERRPDGSVVVRGELGLRDLDRELGTDLQADDDARTVGGLVVHLAGERIPTTGEVFEARDGTRLEILEASPRRVRRVAVRAAEPGVDTRGASAT